MMAISPAHAQQDMPKLDAIESWGRQMNESKSWSDLMQVVEDWNYLSGENGLGAYTAWVLNPIFKANAAYVREAGSLGYAPNFTEMGKGMHARTTKGQEMNERFNEVWTCGWHSEAATMLVHPPTDSPSSALVSASDCPLNEGVAPADMMSHCQMERPPRRAGSRGGDRLSLPRSR